MPVMRNIKTLYQCLDEGGQGDVQPIDDAALVWHGDTITWVGKEIDLPSDGVEGLNDGEAHDAKSCFVIPGLIDCHTHLCFGGWRGDEFAMRSKGADYLEIAKQGGGIMKTVRQTREATEDKLYRHGASHLHAMRCRGVTTVECKSGYGLTLEDELKLLRVYRRLADAADQPVRIVSTLLGAHVVPPEFKDNRPGYLDLLCDELIPQVAEQGLARFNDVFVEDGAFTPDEARRVLMCGKRHGLMPKLHVDQLCDGGGAELAAEVGAVSADHLEYTNAQGIQAMASAGVVAVALPMASLMLRQPPLDARRFIDAGVPIAVATDFNPGSAPCDDLQHSMTLACVMNCMSPAEVLKGVTIYAAKAIGLGDLVGSLRPGMKADFLRMFSPNASIDDALYRFHTAHPLGGTYLGGKAINRKFGNPLESLRNA
ncbi:MAG: imidazolonepropionase [Phycisphaerales bacterium JB063]